MSRRGEPGLLDQVGSRDSFSPLAAQRDSRSCSNMSQSGKASHLGPPSPPEPPCHPLESKTLSNDTRTCNKLRGYPGRSSSEGPSVESRQALIGEEIPILTTSPSCRAGTPGRRPRGSRGPPRRVAHLGFDGVARARRIRSPVVDHEIKPILGWRKNSPRTGSTLGRSGLAEQGGQVSRARRHLRNHPGVQDEPK